MVDIVIGAVDTVETMTDNRGNFCYLPVQNAAIAVVDKPGRIDGYPPANETGGRCAFGAVDDCPRAVRRLYDQLCTAFPQVLRKKHMA